MLYLIGLCVVILMVAIGLGFVIFVHELGHFVVAKLCGVKCEKFYLGFDIAGLKLCKFQWGETEYGIGILPLGGYVKMLGQEDNPARLREELERAKQERGEGREERGEGEQGLVASATGNETPDSAPIYDPRSFLAQSVPKRMAIIAAGVIMNIIFAFLMGVAAFMIGVEQIPCVVGAIFPGEAAWQADIRVGDQIEEIAGKKMTQFRDLQTSISLGDNDPEKGVPLLVRRPGVADPFAVVVKPDASRGAFFIGVANSKEPKLIENRTTWLIQKRSPVMADSPAAKATPAFQNGDRIVQIDEAPIENYSQIHLELARKTDDDITVTVEREGKADSKQRVMIPVARNPMRTVGLVMKMGEITAVQAGSPAAAAGILPGDLIRKIDGNPIDDPMKLPDLLRRQANNMVEVTLQREKSQTPLALPVRLRQPLDFTSPEEMVLLDSPVESSSLGVTYRVLNRVDRVIDGSPAAKAGLLPEDILVQARLIPPPGEKGDDATIQKKELVIDFNESNRNWPSFCNALQIWAPGTTVELKFSRQGKEQVVKLEPVLADNWFNPARGLIFEPMTYDHRAKSFGEALALGGERTLEDTTIVFRSIRALATAKVSTRNLVGPVGIINLALDSADQGLAKLLLFLTMLSANLAVLNFLPIPLLDGGLMVFLLYEGIRGKPADERVQVALTYLGLIFIVVLMVWVLGLDFGWISRR